MKTMALLLLGVRGGAGVRRADGPNGAVKLVSLGYDRYSFKLQDDDCVLPVVK